MLVAHSVAAVLVLYLASQSLTLHTDVRQTSAEMRRRTQWSRTYGQLELVRLSGAQPEQGSQDSERTMALGCVVVAPIQQVPYNRHIAWWCMNGELSVVIAELLQLPAEELFAH